MSKANFFDLKEIVFQILEFLPARKIFSLRRVSKTFDKCATSNYLWERVIETNELTRITYESDLVSFGRINNYFETYSKKYSLCDDPFYLRKNWRYENRSDKNIGPQDKDIFYDLLGDIKDAMENHKRMEDARKRALKARRQAKYRNIYEKYKKIVLWTCLFPPLGVYFQGLHYFERMDEDDDEDINYLGVGSCILGTDLAIHITLTLIFTIIGFYIAGIIYAFIAWALQYLAYEVKFSPEYSEGDKSIIGFIRSIYCLRCFSIGDCAPYCFFTCLSLCRCCRN